MPPTMSQELKLPIQEKEPCLGNVSITITININNLSNNLNDFSKWHGQEICIFMLPREQNQRSCWKPLGKL